ncbi:hypothetical protein DL96DRAFT_1616420 [Flagelloscypha sp. PMI_526]|nr:hypothetical protein DL96DRAFT_1616420 [Flagelloscypha sp. PMI_526]
MTTITSLNNIEDLKGEDVFILFGKTRAGKSTFINDAYQQEVAKSTTGLRSDTNTISYVTTSCSIDRRKIVLVDTIGLGGSGEDHDRVSLAAKWVEIFRPGGDSYTGKGGKLHPTVKGFLYFIDITDGAGLNKDGQRNLAFFKALIGKEVMKSVIFVTTKWTKDENMRDIQEDYYEQWEEEIESDDAFYGASLLRLDDQTSRITERRLGRLPLGEQKEERKKYHDNAIRVLRELLKNEAKAPTQLEVDINEGAEEQTIGQTTLGKQVLGDLKEDATIAMNAGMENEAKELLASAAALAQTPISRAGQIEEAREAAKVILGEGYEKIGEAWYETWELVTMNLWRLAAKGDPQANLDEKFSEIASMNIDWAREGAKYGRNVLGGPGEVVGGLLGAYAAFQVSAWRVLGNL